MSDEIMKECTNCNTRIEPEKIRKCVSCQKLICDVCQKYYFCEECFSKLDGDEKSEVVVLYDKAINIFVRIMMVWVITAIIMFIFLLVDPNVNAAFKQIGIVIAFILTLEIIVGLIYYFPYKNKCREKMRQIFKRRN